MTYTMKQERNKIVTFLLLFTLNVFSQSEHFDRINNSKQWKLVFKDQCTKDWTKHWTLDGLIATVENTKNGMLFKAGPEAKNDAHHAVLWTKATYEGDIKIEYDYTRTDTAIRWVNILYIQATGDGEGNFETDISKWSDFRRVPVMKKYYENMNLLHISYAAFNNQGDGTHYVRARRYPKPNNENFDGTQIPPTYDQQGYAKSGQTYHITAIKTGTQLFFKMESKDGQELFTWDLSEVTPITAGRIGIRHMYTRSAIYSNFKIHIK